MRSGHGAAATDTSLVQVLSLYLLLLCFFILLFQMSRVEELRSKAVAGSLNAAFAANGRPTEDPETLTAMDGTALADARLRDALGDLVRTALPLAEVAVVKPGEAYVVTIPEQAAFLPGTALLRPAVEPVLARMAAAAARGEGDVAFGIEVTVAAPPIPPDALAAGEPLAIGRAGALAAALVAAGARPGTVAAGVEQGVAGDVRLLFRPDGRGKAHARAATAGGPP